MALGRYFVSALTASLVWATALGAQAPAGVITGRVVDASTQQPLVGATVVVEGTQLGTITRDDGTYSMTNVPVGEQAVRVSRIGFAPGRLRTQVTAGAISTLDFELQPAAAVLTELVVTGYGVQRREAITGSVATVSAEEANVGVITSANDMIQGRVAGVNITLNDGEPGAAAQVRIRGGTSISASNEPLYVIDGVPIENVPTEARGIGINSDPPLARNPLALINPSDIESLTILKDAAATAIYGSRAANGVILIETKKGVPGSTVVEYDGYVAVSSAASRLGVLSGSQYRAFVEDYDPDLLAGLGTANTDWESALTRTAMSHNHNLAFSGGSQTMTYRASLNFMEQEGVIIENGMRRLQGRLNASHIALDDRLRLGLNLTGSHVRNDYLPYENTGGFEGGVFTNMVIFDPTRPVTVTDPGTGDVTYYERGPGRQEQRNPVAMAHQVADEGQSTRTLGNVTAALDIITGLTAQLNVGLDRSEGIRRTYLPRISPVGAEFGGRARHVSRDNTATTLQSFVTYTGDLDIGHSFDVVAGYEFAEYSTAEFGAEGRGFQTDAFGYHNLGGGSTLVQPFSWREDHRLVSFFGRANYNFNDRFYLTGVLRRDGSSRFGEGNKWSLFPAISASWRLSEEPFMASTPFSDFRLRVGFGLQGNPGVSPYSSLITLTPGAHYVFGETGYIGVAPNRNANPDLKWEQTAQYNVAIDFGLRDNWVSGTVEYYHKSTSDLLLEVQVPPPALTSTRLENIGEVKNQGLEATLDAVLMSRPNLRWNSGLVFALERSEVVDLGGRTAIQSARASGQGQSDTWAQRLIPGEPLGTFFGPEFVRVAADTLIVGTDTVWRAGEQLFRCDTPSTSCVDGMTGDPTGDDYRVIGNAAPDFTLGFRNQIDFRNFDLTFLIRGEFGRDVFNNTALVYATKTNVTANRNFLESALDDPDAVGEPAIYSSRWIEDGSFIRLQNVTLGYTFAVPRMLGLAETARVYLSGDNLLLLTDYSGYDPEVHTAAEGLAVRGIDYLNYPRPRTITTGIRFSF